MDTIARSQLSLVKFLKNSGRLFQPNVEKAMSQVDRGHFVTKHTPYAYIYQVIINLKNI